MVRPQNEQRPRRYARDFHHVVAERRPQRHARDFQHADPEHGVPISAEEAEEARPSQRQPKMRKISEIMESCQREENLRTLQAARKNKKQNHWKRRPGALRRTTVLPLRSLDSLQVPDGAALEQGGVQSRVLGLRSAARVQAPEQEEVTSIANGGSDGKFGVVYCRRREHTEVEALSGNPSPAHAHGIESDATAATQSDDNNNNVQLLLSTCTGGDRNEEGCPEMQANEIFATMLEAVVMEAAVMDREAMAQQVPAVEAHEDEDCHEMQANKKYPTMLEAVVVEAVVTAVMEAAVMDTTTMEEQVPAVEAHDKEALGEVHNLSNDIKHESLPTWGGKKERSFKYNYTVTI